MNGINYDNETNQMKRKMIEYINVNETNLKWTQRTLKGNRNDIMDGKKYNKIMVQYK